MDAASFYGGAQLSLMIELSGDALAYVGLRPTETDSPV